MPRCLHRNVQEFTEMCMDCGRSIYETDEGYLKYLREEKARRSAAANAVTREIEALEEELGIKRS
jgi:hypothetical protein